jgi:tetratricopeptide (TPR) repeat protein
MDQTRVILARLGIIFCQPEFLFRKANALVALARHDEALAVLDKAVSLGERLGARFILWKIYASLADLQSECGHPTKADAARRNAREHLSFVADHAPADLSQSFLQLPTVMKLLGE